jgi:hypothetical protein
MVLTQWTNALQRIVLLCCSNSDSFSLDSYDFKVFDGRGKKRGLPEGAEQAKKMRGDAGSGDHESC